VSSLPESLPLAASSRAPRSDAWPSAGLRLSRWLDQPRSPRTLVVWLALYLLLAANWPLWHELARIGGGAPSLYMPMVAVLAALLFCANVGLLTLTAWSRWAKPLWVLVAAIAAVVQHYMLTYRVVMDPGMLANAMATDAGEVRDLLSVSMLLQLLLVAGPVAWFLWRVPMRRVPMLGQLWRNAALLLAMAVLAAGTIVVSNRQLAPLMRNHTTLRYMMNPVASIYSATKVTLGPVFSHRRQFIPITAGTQLGAAYATQQRPPMLVLVVGETARADHFGLNGYARDTTPALAARGVLSWKAATSCGTSTLASVPCMFSPLGRDQFVGRKDDYENLMDVLQASGLAVLWLDNQPGGCKGVCDRVPHASTFSGLDDATRKALCRGDECLDEVMLKGLDERLAAMPAERRAKGVVLVMHQMGSHGPAYFERSSAAAKRFMPECRTNVLTDCTHGELVNAFDNTIAYTDQFLGQVIDWLQARSGQYDPALLYMSDHGESLGEYGLFLHGVPYDLAPQVQKHVPLVMWFGQGMRARDQLSTQCLGARLDAPVSHDNLFHTVLGVMDVQNSRYQGGMDLVESCRVGGAADAKEEPPAVAPLQKLAGMPLSGKRAVNTTAPSS